MSKLAAIVLLWLALGLDLAMRNSFGVAPSVVIALVATVAAFAPTTPAMLFAAFAGALVDLTSTLELKPAAAATLGTGSATPFGFYTLGLMLAAWITAQARGIFLRRNPFSLVVLSILAAVIAHTVALGLLLIRYRLDSAVEFAPRFWPSMVSALLTGIPGLVLGFLWKWLLVVLNLPDPFTRQSLYGRNPI